MTSRIHSPHPMTDGQEDRLSMFLAVEAACQRHRALWETERPAFARAFADFQGRVAEIRRLSDAQHSVVRAAKRQKSKARRAMEDSAHMLGGALSAWATVNGENRLAERAYLSRNAWLKLRDTVCLTRASLILKEGRSRLADLGDYGVTGPLLDDLEARIETYRTELAAPRMAIFTRKGATSGLKAGIAAASELLRTQLDKLMPILAADHPAFGTDYRNARVIVGSGGGKARKGRK
ncbi:MAG: hypothetical protein KDL87_07135 [Verrucomicrobiae bacterium]|nr:hypothetical protein [Verrucomicrobiae bacterium]